MKAAWRAELIKLITVRGFGTGLLAATLLTPLASLLVVTTGGLGERDTITSGAATGSVAGLIGFGVWGAAVTGSEYLHRTMTVSLVLVPRRPVLYGAKVAAVAALAGSSALVSILLALVLVRASTPPGAHELGNPAALFVVVLAAAAVGVVGAALGTATRTSTAAIGIVVAAVLLPKAAAGLLGGLQPWVVGSSPGTVITQVVRGGQLATDQTYPLGTAAAVFAMLVVAAAVVLGGGLAFLRRDG